MTKHLYCTVCGSIGLPRIRNRGSSVLEVLLWACFLVPGFCYTLWRMGNKDRFCRTCSAPNPIPLSSPLAGRALGTPVVNAGAGAVEPEPAAWQAHPTTRQIGWRLMLGIIFVPYIFGWALAGKGYSNVARTVTAIWALFMVAPFVLAAAFEPQSAQAPTAPAAPAARPSLPKLSAPEPEKDPDAVPAPTEWDSTLDGHRIKCGIAAGGIRFYLVIPTPDEYENGERVIANKNPSEPMWQEACAKQGVISSW